MGIAGWNLGEKLINGPNNGSNVNHIIGNTLNCHSYIYATSHYQWPRDMAKRYIKEVLTQQYNQQRNTMRKAELSVAEQERLKKRTKYNTRKTYVSSTCVK